MAKLSRLIGNSPEKRVNRARTALPAFRYEAGYKFSASDLGKIGVKIELNNEYDTGAAIILPPRKVGECGTWLFETIGQENHSFLKELRGILERLSKQSGLRPTLQRGDKKKIKDALKVLNSQSSRTRDKGPVLRSLSKKAI